MTRDQSVTGNSWKCFDGCLSLEEPLRTTQKPHAGDEDMNQKESSNEKA